MDTVRWGILGAAKFAREHMGPALALAAGGRLAALATRAPQKAAPFRDLAHDLRIHASYEALLDDPGIDAVYVPLPNALHVDWTLKAAAAGKHVLCEKPMAMQAADFDQLIAARDAAGVLVAEAFMIVFHPQWQLVRDLLAEGALGRLCRIDGAFSFLNRDRCNIRNQAAAGGGSLRDIGVYTLGSTRFATGQEPVVTGASIVWEDGIDIYADVRARFGEVPFSAFTAIRMHPRQEMVYHGEDAVLRLPVPFNARVAGEARVEIARGTSAEVIRFPAQNQYELQVAAFNRAVLEGDAYACPLEFSRGTQAAMDAVFAAGG